MKSEWEDKFMEAFFWIAAPTLQLFGRSKSRAVRRMAFMGVPSLWGAIYIVSPEALAALFSTMILMAMAAMIWIAWNEI